MQDGPIEPQCNQIAEALAGIDRDTLEASSSLLGNKVLGPILSAVDVEARAEPRGASLCLKYLLEACLPESLPPILTQNAHPVCTRGIPITVILVTNVGRLREVEYEARILG